VPIRQGVDGPHSFSESCDNKNLLPGIEPLFFALVAILVELLRLLLDNEIGSKVKSGRYTNR
jgi:hypothetical protein